MEKNKNSFVKLSEGLRILCYDVWRGWWRLQG